MTRDSTVIGRREDADFRIPLSDVSRKHCRLIKDGVTLILKDLGSSNGTLRNGEKVKECELAAGDTLRIGPIQFVVQIDGVPAEEDVASPRPARVASPAASVSASQRTLTPPPTPPNFDSSTFDVAPEPEAADKA